MPTEFAPGQTQQEALAVVDPTKDDPVCIEINVGYKFCGDLKKFVTHFSNLITNRPAVLHKLSEEEQKVTPVVTAEIFAAKDVLHAFYEAGQKNVHVGDMTELMNAFYTSVNSMGNDMENIKKFNVEFTKCTRGVFKMQQNCLVKLKGRKKELQAQAN